MNVNRRQFLKTTSQAGLALTAAPFSHPPYPAKPLDEPSVAICDWNLGDAADPSLIPKAQAAGLAGIQVSVGTRPDHVPLRDPDVREQYLALGEEHGIAFPSVAAGSILNQIPLASEPQAAVYVIDAIEAAAALGSTNVLMAFFGNGDLRLRDAMGDFRNLSDDGPFSQYELDAQGVTRVVEALRQIAPRARDAGVVLGLENTLTAEQNLEVIRRVGSEWVQVYYDVGNATSYGYDVPGELRMLGKDRICEIHLKETLSLPEEDKPLLGAPASGGVDFEAVAAACADIGYDGWYTLETSGRDGHFQEDTQANVAFVDRLFA